MCSHSGGRRRCTATPAAPEARRPQPPGSNRRRLGYSGTTGAAIPPAPRARRRIWQARAPHLRRLGNQFYLPIALAFSILLQPWLAPLTLALHSYLFPAGAHKGTPSDWMSRMWKRIVKQSATSLNPGKYSVECPRNGKDMKVASLFFNVQSQVVCPMIFLMSGSSNLLNSVCLDRRKTLAFLHVAGHGRGNLDNKCAHHGQCGCS